MGELKIWLDEEARAIASGLAEINIREMREQSAGGYGLRTRVVEFLSTVRSALFPTLYDVGASTPGHLVALSEERVYTAAEQLFLIARGVFEGLCGRDERGTCDRAACRARAEGLTIAFMRKLKDIRELLSGDLRAAYDGDPAARYMEEILLSYPSIEAMSAHRVAHELYKLELPVVPRILSEDAHAHTGIDIHPGATIGRHFFIDHGTGVVIGETTVIGDNVKLYQGVTLGARSFPKDEHGNPVKGIKRHPNIEDDVIIYAGATILGGDVVIGRGSVIGGNTWIMQSVPPDSRVSAKSN